MSTLSALLVANPHAEPTINHKSSWPLKISQCSNLNKGDDLCSIEPKDPYRELLCLRSHGLLILLRAKLPSKGTMLLASCLIELADRRRIDKFSPGAGILPSFPTQAQAG